MSKITTIKEIPTGLEKFFEKFINIFTKKTVLFEGNELTIEEIGPREDYKSAFQCVPATSSNAKFEISFEKSESGIDVYFESTYKSNMPDMSQMTANLPFGGNMMGGMMKKMMEQASDMMQQMTGTINQPLDNQMITLVKSSIQKTIKKLKEKKQKEKDKKHNDKDKKHDDKDKKHKEKEKTSKDPLTVLKLKFVEGEISEEEYLRKKKLLME